MRKVATAALCLVFAGIGVLAQTATTPQPNEAKVNTRAAIDLSIDRSTESVYIATVTVHSADPNQLLFVTVESGPRLGLAREVDISPRTELSFATAYCRVTSKPQTWRFKLSPSVVRDGFGASTRLRALVTPEAIIEYGKGEPPPRARPEPTQRESLDFQTASDSPQLLKCPADFPAIFLDLPRPAAVPGFSSTRASVHKEAITLLALCPLDTADEEDPR